jgi:hypothetical protein
MILFIFLLPYAANREIIYLPCGSPTPTLRDCSFSWRPFYCHANSSSRAFVRATARMRAATMPSPHRQTPRPRLPLAAAAGAAAVKKRIKPPSHRAATIKRRTRRLHAPRSRLRACAKPHPHPRRKLLRPLSLWPSNFWQAPRSALPRFPWSQPLRLLSIMSAFALLCRLLRSSASAAFAV